MHVTVCYFAAVRERLGTAQEQLELSEADATMGALWARLCQRHPQLAPLKPYLRFSRNLEFVDDSSPLAEGDEVGVIPPIAGGAEQLLSAEPLDEAAIAAAVDRPEAGAVVTFRGAVRNHSKGRDVAWLEYEVYPPMAEAKLQQVIDETEAAHPGVRVALRHRFGRLDIGDAAVVIAASAPHRQAAFDACRFAIDRIKDIVPIWKKEVGPDGESWVGMGS